MATVVITFLLIVRLNAYKMDDDLREKRRARISSQREKRWSMNSQRLEEIVAELMRPIGDLRHSFDTDLSALLEEYLTEAGLHALEAEDGPPAGPAPAVPNFAELALLLQQSASIYGRKVDCLYQHVLAVSDSLHNSTLEISNSSNNNETELETPSKSKRKRRATLSGEFGPIALEASGGARREAGCARPPPTLPRVYLELEPRVLRDEEPLRDYAGEPIGLVADFHVAWRLQAGMLVDELAGDAAAEARLRPIPLMELQAAIEAAAPPSPPPLLLREESPPRCSTPLSPAPQPPDPAPAMPPPAPSASPAPLKRERKRKSEVKVEEIDGSSIKLHISKELRASLAAVREFDGAALWVARVVAERARAVAQRRRELRARGPSAGPLPFRGFEFCALDVSGFGGWSASEAAAAVSRARGAGRDDSSDDGFFEQSSLGDSDASRHDEPPPPPPPPPSAASEPSAEALEWAAWRARVAARAAAQEQAPPLDVRALAAALLRQLPPSSPPTAAPAVPVRRVLAATAKEDTDVSRLFLATLFLANAGNVEIVQGPPLSLNSFSLRLRSSDERLYAGALAAELAAAAAPAPAAAAPPR